MSLRELGLVITDLNGKHPPSAHVVHSLGLQTAALFGKTVKSLDGGSLVGYIGCNLFWPKPLLPDINTY